MVICDSCKRLDRLTKQEDKNANFNQYIQIHCWANFNVKASFYLNYFGSVISKKD